MKIVSARRCGYLLTFAKAVYGILRGVRAFVYRPARLFFTLGFLVCMITERDTLADGAISPPCGPVRLVLTTDNNQVSEGIQKSVVQEWLKLDGEPRFDGLWQVIYEKRLTLEDPRCRACLLNEWTSCKSVWEGPQSHYRMTCGERKQGRTLLEECQGYGNLYRIARGKVFGPLRASADFTAEEVGYLKHDHVVIRIGTQELRGAISRAANPCDVISKYASSLPGDISAQLRDACNLEPPCELPHLSYSLTSFHRGDLARTCEKQVTSAKAMGFTTISLIPAIAYDTRTNKILPPSHTMNTSELTSCLEVIWDSGMDLIYQPHLDSIATLSSTGEKDWRAHFDFDPRNSQYFDSMFKEFLKFLSKKRERVAVGERQVDIVIAAEVDLSTTKYPSKWRELLQKLRSLLRDMQILYNVRLGLNPNWYPLYDPKKADCSDFQALVEEVDFIAPSFYGDWRNAARPDSSWRDVEIRKKQVLARLSRDGAVGCSIPTFKTRPFSVGEFGTGYDIARTAAEGISDSSTLAKFKEDRRRLYRNILDWAANDETLRRFPPLWLNIWTTGIWDPVKASGSQKSMADPKIETMFRRYSEDRCKAAVAPTESALRKR